MEEIFNTIARIAGGFSAPARIKIIRLLGQAPRSVEQIAEQTGETMANCSQHLQRLLRDGVVKVQREKLSRIYSLRHPAIADFLEELFDIGEVLRPEIVQGPESSELVSLPLAQIMRDVEEKRAVLLDVRDLHEFKHTPVRHARSFPLTDLRTKLQMPSFALDLEKTYYLFCRGRFCPMAVEAVKILRHEGYKAYGLRQSPLELKAQFGGFDE